VWKTQSKWQDGYCGQETIIINELRTGGIKYELFLEMIDRYPFYVERRSREAAPFLARHIIVTSALAPIDVFIDLPEEDSLDNSSVE